MSWTVTGGYAVTTGKPRLLLHRVLAEKAGWQIEGMLLDHKNGLVYDNRLENLRPTTPTGNSRNKKMQKNNTSGFRGVSFDKERGTWNAYIKDGPAKRKIGRFKTPEAASAAYEAAAAAAFGEFFRPLELAR